VRTAIVIGIAALTSIAAINTVSAVSNHYVRGYTARNGTLSSLTRKRTPNATKFDNWPTSEGKHQSVHWESRNKESILD
jgi:hypothetical protein